MTFYWIFGASVCSTEINLGFVQFDWFKVIILGIVQGITELLPISSTAHLRIVPAVLGWPDPGSAFSAAMQLASLAAVVTYFWLDIQMLVGGMVRAVATQNYQSRAFQLPLGLIVGTIPIGIAGLLLKKSLNACNSPFRSLMVVGIASIVMALLLALAEKRGKRDRSFKQLSLQDGIWVRLAKALALIPGVSRSGSTLTAGLFLGMERETAAKFSFLLGLPAVVLAGALELHTLFKAGLSLDGWITLLIGLTSASVSAFLAIYGLLHYKDKAPGSLSGIGWLWVSFCYSAQLYICFETDQCRSNLYLSVPRTFLLSTLSAMRAFYDMNSISETAYAVAMYRALETERPDALFLDTHARLLAGGRGELIAKILGNERQIANLIAVRTHLIDEIIEQLVDTESIDTVLNLAAGLDMRPYRLSLPPKLRWIEVDLPDVLDYKTQKLSGEKPDCILERFKLDLTDIASRNILFSTINSQSRSVLILTEGLLSYLSDVQVQLLSADLYRQTNFRWWLFEIISSAAFKDSVNDWSQKIANQYFSDGTPIFQYTPDAGAEFFQSRCWNVAQVRYVWEESRQLRRGIWFAELFSEFVIRRFAQENWEALRQHNRIILLERQSFC